MSDNEEENFCFYGKPLDPYDEDLFPKKRPITVEEQIATDAQGRRRFHGAFTGGFSAGFFNTVGSLEGWTPSEFKSSRSEKQNHVIQNPEDFMDDEDMGEFGFAPQTIRATKDYDTSKKRKRKVFRDGPIPGEPVLHTLLTTGNETVGYLLLKNIGLKDKIEMKEKENSTSSSDRVYGCEMPKLSAVPQLAESKDYELPEFYKEFLSKPKNDTFGLGYTGLDKSHVNLFRSSDLVVREKDKKLSIRGQAFGVGAFENDDDDIYAKEDISNYDFELTKEENTKKQIGHAEETLFDMFIKAKRNSFAREIFPPPVIPKSFTGKYKVKKSRFEPIVTPQEVERKKITPMHRAELLGEEITETFTSSKPVSSSSQENKMKTVKVEENSQSNQLVSSTNTNASDLKNGTKRQGFDPTSLWNDRFVSAVQDDDGTNILAPVKKFENDHYSKDMRDAAKLKMYGPLTRISQDWHPCSLLCKRFNVPEPLIDKPSTSRNRTRTKNLIFEYQKHQEENIILKAGLTSVSSTTSNILSNSVQDEGIETPKLEVKEEVDDSIGQEDMMEQDKVADTAKENEQSKEEEKVIEIIDITDRLNIEEKTDLFKAVFLSRSESEDETEDTKQELEEKEDEAIREREEELKSNILGQEIFLPKIKPVKEGILSGLNFKAFHAFSKPTERLEEEKTDDNLNKDDSSFCDKSGIDTYGPKLPEKKIGPASDGLSSIGLNNKSSNSDSDEWVERDEDEKVKKKKKKHTKEKSQRKEHKHKRKHKKKKSKK